MIRDNRLFWTLSAFASAYWLVGIFVPGTQLTALASVLLLFGGMTTLRQYGPVAWQVVFHKLRNEDIPQGYGAHLAVLGTALLAAGAVWSGFATAVWVYGGQQPYWLDSPFFGFGRYMMAGGFMLAHVSPSMTQEGISVTRGWLLWVAGLAILAFGIFVGAFISRPDPPPLVACGVSQPIKGNHTRTARLYHLPGTPSYDRTVPEACYATEFAAMMDGYRPAGG